LSCSFASKAVAAFLQWRLTIKKIGATWPTEPHTEAKHAILRKYLGAWLPIMTKWNGRVLHIDIKERFRPGARFNFYEFSFINYKP
jgi:hypothetical protein